MLPRPGSTNSGTAARAWPRHLEEKRGEWSWRGLRGSQGEGIERGDRGKEGLEVSARADEALAYGFDAARIGCQVFAFAVVKEAYTLLSASKNKATTTAATALSPAMLEGFVAAKVLVAGLRKAGKNPTSASLVAALNRLDRFDLGGLSLTYSPKSHTGLIYTNVAIIGTNNRFQR